MFTKKIKAILFSIIILTLISCGGGGGGNSNTDPQNIPVNYVNGFGDNGILSISIGRADDEVNSIAATSDGGIIAAGYIMSSYSSENSYTQNGFIFRVKNDGNLDTTFGDNGRVKLQIIISGSAKDNEIKDIAIQDDGRIVVAGNYATIVNANKDVNIFIARFNSDGTLDTTFGTAGVVRKSIGTDDDHASGLQIQTDGKIVVVGDTYNVSASNIDVFVCRLNSDGTFDSNFSTDGVVTTDIGSRNNVARDVAIQPDNKIVVAGYHSNSSTNTNDFLVLRYTSTGVLDTSFDSDGYVYTSLGAGHDEINSVSLKNGNIYVAGSSANGAVMDAAFACYTGSGALDSNFSTDGVTTIHPSSGNYYINNLFVQSDGAVIATGKYSLSSAEEAVLVKLASDGNPDTDFGTDGLLTLNTGSNNSSNSILVLSDGSLIIAGYESHDDNKSSMIKKFNAEDGSADATFNANDSLLQTGYTQDGFEKIARQSDGKIIAKGYASYGIEYDNSSTYKETLVRINADGSLDTSFGTDGMVVYYYRLYNLYVLNDDSIIITTRLNNHFVVEKLTKNGDPDTSFGTAGRFELTTEFSAAFVTLQADEKILVAGTNSSKNFIVARIDTDGAIDTTFGTGGILTGVVVNTDISSRKMILQSDGKILITGQYNSSPGNYIGMIIRFNSDGTLDTSFNSTGIVNTVMSDINDVLITSENQIVICGSSFNLAGSYSYTDIVIMRYNSDGSLDNTFGTAGMSVLDYENNTNYAQSLREQDDGKFIVVGNNSGGYTGYTSIVARFNKSGSLDKSFASNGYFIIDVSDYYEISDTIFTEDNGDVEMLFCGFITNYHKGTSTPDYSDDFESMLTKISY